jgi:hypothetical protein
MSLKFTIDKCLMDYEGLSRKNPDPETRALTPVNGYK